MNKLLLCTALALVASGATNCLADSAIPSLVGKWTGEKEFAKILKTESPVGRSHTPHEEFGKVAVEVEFTAQQGRLLKGTKTSERWSEKMVCAIDYDNKGLYCTDENGIFDGQIVGAGEIIMHYRHITSDNSIVSLMKLTKKE